MPLATKPRWDKTNPYVGNHRAHLAADVPTTLYNKVIAVGKNSAGLVVVGAGTSGVDGLMIIPVGQDIHGDILDGGINNRAGDPTDVGQLGEITNFEPWLVGVAAGSQPDEKAGTVYYGHPDGSVTDSTGPGAVVVGRTAEKTRLIVNVNLVGPGGSYFDNVPIGIAAAGGDDSAVLSWTAVKGATQYKLFKSDDGTTFTAATPATVAAPATSATVTGLTAGTRYFKVKATVGGVDSADSRIVSAVVV